MKLAIIVGATREGRRTLRQAKWITNTAQATEGIEVELVDLKDYPMPFFDEPVSPRYNPNRTLEPVVQKWLNKIAEFDAYIFVTSEYNHGIPGVLKNAIDYLGWELKHKPAAAVSHGSAGGSVAQASLREILSISQAIVLPTPSSLAMTNLADSIDEEGTLSEEAKANPYGPHGGLEALLADIVWLDAALKKTQE